tara:strand:+ start:2201 stop:2644 length:444 start_codon:yes stop_codon:yes gene_type:complete
MFKRIIVVCSGNICRSPLAQVLLDKMLPQVEVDSAGVVVEQHQLTGHPAVENSTKLAYENGLDLSQHSAKQLTKELIDGCDLILVMTHDHIDQVANITGGARAKTLLLGQWIGIGDIEDPIGRDMDIFIRCYNTIEKAVLSWSKRLA